MTQSTQSPGVPFHRVVESLDERDEEISAVRLGYDRLGLVGQPGVHSETSPEL